MKTKKIAASLIALLIMLMATSTCFAAHGENVLRPGESLTPGQFLISHNGQFYLRMQTDGNLVMYNQFGFALWSTGTVGARVDKLIMQTDGNLVMYAANGHVYWQTHTQGHYGAYLKASSNACIEIRWNGTAIRSYP
ncbi:lectin [Vallitalea pronyensis]|uniref:Lectin n=1 Tax=Vallitalea pronyensis TaxID=1348613 RepID=A0A8J8MG25_9FIRM|nr:hypothetical protein [Vallitalea pronyensis]QUI20842.1 lectin [Vallitalea pronyensis]